MRISEAWGVAKVSEFSQGFLSGALVAVVAFLLAVGWELRRDHKRSEQSKKAARSLLLAAVSRTRRAADRNLRILADERAALTSNKITLNALRRLDTAPFHAFFNSWLVLYGLTPLAEAVSSVIQVSDEINDQISERTLMKAACAALSTLGERLDAVDGLLEERGKVLEAHLGAVEVQAEMLAFERTHRWMTPFWKRKQRTAKKPDQGTEQ